MSEDSRQRYIYGVPEIPEDRPSRYSLDDDPNEIRDILSMLHPQLDNATMDVDENGNIHFATAAGEKG